MHFGIKIRSPILTIISYFMWLYICLIKNRIYRTFMNSEKSVYPTVSSVLWVCEVSFAYVQVSAAYPKSIGFWQAMLMIQAFSSSVISVFLPRPEASKSTFSIPPSLNFYKQSMTLQRLRPTLSAIVSIDTASACNNRIRALVTV